MRRSVPSFILSLCLIGCSGDADTPDLGQVSGKVTLDEKPLPKANVTFMPEDGGGRGATGTTNDSGVYELKYSPDAYGAIPGKYKVTISTKGTTTDAEGNDVAVPETVPMEYNVQTTLSREVKAGDNTFDFPLKSGGKISQPDTEDSGGGTSSSPTCGE